ncbi:hypothetical protein [Neobacillus muris]|uniref:hypothetical protein n=1 Tax=Neobacillus muris TaxID=2941334 RepID=UPI00203BF7C7|nr:hypothetical protein [Neobacillus muris]
MYIIASFEQSIYLELAISSLEQHEIARHQILAVPLDKRKEERKLFDTIHQADGYSLFDVAAVIGTCFMLLGAIYGMILQWGPILWGLIGLAAGLILGTLLKLLFIKKQSKTLKRSISTEVFLMVHCLEEQRKMVEEILWDNLALGVGKLKE